MNALFYPQVYFFFFIFISYAHVVLDFFQHAYIVRLYAHLSFWYTCRDFLFFLWLWCSCLVLSDLFFFLNFSLFLFHRRTLYLATFSFLLFSFLIYSTSFRRSFKTFSIYFHLPSGFCSSFVFSLVLACFSSFMLTHGWFNSYPLYVHTYLYEFLSPGNMCSLFLNIFLLTV